MAFKTKVEFKKLSDSVQIIVTRYTIVDGREIPVSILIRETLFESGEDLVGLAGEMVTRLKSESDSSIAAGSAVVLPAAFEVSD